MDMRKRFHLKDRNGDTVELSMSHINESPILHFIEFPSVVNNLDAIRTAEPRPDDVWILSYPKSGAHWLYENMGILLSGKLESLKEFKEKTFFEMAKLEDLERLPSPRVLSTHLRPKYFPKGKLEKEKLIFILRNPKSVAVSYYHHIRNIKTCQYEGSFDGFYDLYMNGVEDLCGSWFEYHSEWWDVLKKRDNVLILYYEELKKDTVSNLQKICTFLGVSRDEEFCQKTAQLCSFDTMKINEGKNSEALEKYKELLREGTSFMRKGQIDDWKNYFTVKQNEDFQKIFDEKMKNFPEIVTSLHYE